MEEQPLSISLPDSPGNTKTLGEWIKGAPFTIIVFYRGDW